MSSGTLSVLLCLMALVPPLTIAVLWNILPPYSEGKLDCTVVASALPDPAIYSLPLDERPEQVRGGMLLVTNNGTEDWTHINVWVNGHYQIYDLVPLPAGATREYALDQFVTRFGAALQLRYTLVRKVLVYARLPKGNRATREVFFDPPNGADR